MNLLLWAGLALAEPVACDGPAEPYLADVAERGDQDSYLCLITRDEMLEPLVAAIRSTPEAEEQARNRYTRALALHLATRSEQPWDPDHVRLLNPADRRLLADAVKARRGRKSPSPEHDAVFQKQAWYRVDKTYTDNELTEVERANIAMADKPPPPAPPSSTQTVEIELPVPQAAPPSACGCGSASGGERAGVLVAFVLAWWRRRQLARAIRIP